MSERSLQDDEDLIRRLDAERGGKPPEAPAPAGDAEARGEWARQDAALRLLYGGIAGEGVPERFAAVLRRAAGAGTAGAGPGAAPPGPAGSGRGGSPRPARTVALPRRFRPLAAAAAFVAVGSALGFGAARLGSPPAGGLDFAQAALLAHRTFAPEVTHPVEMSAADPERLAAWLGRRVGRPLTLPDFSPEGFRLVGGRILPDPDGPAAALMYEDSQGRRVTLYLAPEPGVRETALRLVEGGGTQGWWWVEDGFGCAVVGDAPRDVLKVMAARAYEALG